MHVNTHINNRIPIKIVNNTKIIKIITKDKNANTLRFESKNSIFSKYGRFYRILYIL